MTNPYTDLGWRRLEADPDMIVVYQINWKHVDNILVPRAIKNHSHSTKLGPLRVKICKSPK